MNLNGIHPIAKTALSEEEWTPTHTGRWTKRHSEEEEELCAPLQREGQVGSAVSDPPQ